MTKSSTTQSIIALNSNEHKGKEMKYPPRFGPLAAVTPGTPGGLMTMLAEWGTMSLDEVLAPAMDMAKGYPIVSSNCQWHRAKQKKAQRMALFQKSISHTSR